MTTTKAAGVLGITDRAVRHACKAGRLPAQRSSNGRWRIARADLDTYRQRAA